MTNRMPSMTALLGMLALAGYQNRDKISEMLRGAAASGTASTSEAHSVDCSAIWGARWVVQEAVVF
jgi:uncharacterized protein YidB (DUF937 family)